MPSKITAFKAANAQLQEYLTRLKFNTRTNIKSFVVVVAGDKLAYKELKLSFELRVLSSMELKTRNSKRKT